MEETPSLAPDPPQPDKPFAEGGLLAENILHFTRVLRRAGLPVGPGRTLEAVEAVRAVGVRNRTDFYWTLHAVFVHRRDQREIFDQAFHMFWRKPDFLERLYAMLLPTIGTAEHEQNAELSPRVADALRGDQEPPEDEEGADTPEQEDLPGQEIEVDATLTFSAQEVLAGKDFEKMTAAEFAEAKQAMARLVLPLEQVRTRRWRPDAAGSRPDPRATLRLAGRRGGAWVDLCRRSRKTRRPPVVVLCDISGSMERYARIFLHFLVALANDRDRVHGFLFGTRLTNVTRHLRHRDPDKAAEAISEAVADWSGGTRIGPALAEFNRVWSRRVLGQGAMVLLITDGLDREDTSVLDREVERLSKSCRRLIWLNPLLRWDGYLPKARGARSLIRHVDSFRPVHNLASLSDLARALSNTAPGLDPSGDPARWRRLLERVDAEDQQHS